MTPMTRLLVSLDSFRLLLQRLHVHVLGSSSLCKGRSSAPCWCAGAVVGSFGAPVSVILLVVAPFDQQTRVSLVVSRYDVPDFLPDVLVALSRHLRDPSPIPATVKHTFREFRRTHLVRLCPSVWLQGVLTLFCCTPFRTIGRNTSSHSHRISCQI